MLDRKLVGTMLLLFASCGCRTCTSCCDDLPPVLDGPYSHVKGRAGSAFTGVSYELPQRNVDNIDIEDSPTAGNGE